LRGDRIPEAYSEPLTMENKKQFTITNRIAKHGRQAVIVVPKILENQLKPGTIVELNIDVLQGVIEE
jgi:hypothetical protein